MANFTVTTEHLKAAAKKGEFRKLFPELKSKFEAYISKPGCSSCAKNLIEALSQSKDKLKEYFGDVEFDIDIPEAFDSIPKVNNFKVVNCSIYELENELNKMPPGSYQITAARYQNEVTVVINKLD